MILGKLATVPATLLKLCQFQELVCLSETYGGDPRNAHSLSNPEYANSEAALTQRLTSLFSGIICSDKDASNC